MGRAASVRPSGLNATARMRLPASPAMASVAIRFLVATFHSPTWPVSPAMARVRPSGLNATLMTSDSARVAVSSPVEAFHSAI